MWGAQPNRKPTFFWQGLLIILPVVMMSVIGLVAVRRDRAAVEAEAQRGAGQLVSQLAFVLTNSLPTQLAAYDRFSDVWYGYQWELTRKPQLSTPSENYASELAQWQGTNPGLNPVEVFPNRIDFGADEAMVWPPDYSEPPLMPTWILGLTEAQSRAWGRLSGCDPSRVTSKDAQVIAKDFFETKPSDGARANAEFFSLKSDLKQQNTLEAVQALESFSDKCRGLRSESGLPLLSLVAVEALRLLRQTNQAAQILNMDINDRGGYVTDIISWALDEPSLLTPQFLSELESLVAEHGGKTAQFRPAISAAQAIWRTQERLHEIAELVRDRKLFRADVATNFWLDSASGSWFCRVNSGQILLPERNSEGTWILKTNSVMGLWVYPKALIASLVGRLVRESGVAVPEYVNLSVELEHVSLGLRHPPSIDFEAVPTAAEVWSRPDRHGRSTRQAGYYLTGTLDDNASRPVAILAETMGRFATLPKSWTTENASGEEPRPFAQFEETPFKPEFKVQIYLTDPELLFAQQRQRTLLFGGLILASTLTACVGLLTAYRAFRRQLRLNQLKSDFVSSVSHELRAPIASVRLMAESLEGGKIPDSKKQHEYFQFIVQECRRLSSLIENVLDFSRIEQGRKQFEFEPTDIVELTRRTVNLMQAYAAERQIALALNIGEKLVEAEPHLVADGKAVQQALINLIDNAIKHSPKGKTVTVGLETRSSVSKSQQGQEGLRQLSREADRTTLALWVEDRGEGIPEEEQSRIFERFYRIGSELRRETQGVGIGLSIVKHVVEAHGGRVLVDSAVGKGSRFTLEIPFEGNHSSNAE
jgi:signal transduction histidine kinase